MKSWLSQNSHSWSIVLPCQWPRVELLPAHRALEFGIYAVYPSRKHLAPKVRVLVDFLVDALASDAVPC